MANTFTFNGSTKLIQVDGTGSIDVANLYSRWKDFVISSNGKFQPAFRFVGGDPTVEGQALGVTYFLINDWDIRPAPVNHILVVNGNLFREGGGNPFIPAEGSANVTIQQSVSSLVDTRVAESPSQHKLEYDNTVYLDPIMGNSGSSHPTGLYSDPVNNLSEALDISNNYGLKNIYINNEVEFMHPVSNKVIESLNLNSTSVILTPSSSFNRVSFKNIYVQGNLGDNDQTNGLSFYECRLQDIDNFEGLVTDSSIEGFIRPRSNNNIIFKNCRAGAAQNEPMIIDMTNVVNVSLTFRGYIGRLDIRGLSDSDSRIDINIQAGIILIESTCTDGIIEIEGISELTDNSQGTNVEYEGLHIPKYNYDMWNQQGLFAGPVTVSPFGRSGSRVDQTFQENPDGSITIIRND